MIPRLLFIIKRREQPWGDPNYSCTMSSGLLNSVRFLVDALTQHGINAVLEEAIDNNDIDRLITKHPPTHVIIEAFWVVPEKFDILKALHPTVRWLVRNHSELPFLANEGMAIEWSREYMRRGIEVMSNAPRAVAAMRAIAVANRLPEQLSSYGPNVYPEPAAAQIVPHLDHGKPALDIACFGAIRPLKNHLQQAVAAISFGDAVNRTIRFHINATRIEGGGSPILKNLRALFEDAQGHELVEHAWLPHAQFLTLMATMDIAMQVSYSETFNIVTADAMAQSVPIVASNDVPWIGSYAQVDPNAPETIVELMLKIWGEGRATAIHRLHQQRRDLSTYCRSAIGEWLKRFRPRQRF